MIHIRIKRIMSIGDGICCGEMIVISVNNLIIRSLANHIERVRDQIFPHPEIICK